MWTYRQIDGHLLAANGELAAVGYAGNGDGLNNPAMQDVPNVGPIPVGLYTVGAPRDSPTTGHYALPLTPHDGNEMFGRDGFEIHGDEIAHPGEFLASDGCIVLSYAARFNCWESGDHILKVISGLEEQR